MDTSISETHTGKNAIYIFNIQGVIHLCCRHPVRHVRFNTSTLVTANIPDDKSPRGACITDDDLTAHRRSWSPSYTFFFFLPGSLLPPISLLYKSWDRLQPLCNPDKDKQKRMDGLMVDSFWEKRYSCHFWVLSNLFFNRLLRTFISKKVVSL